MSKASSKANPRRSNGNLRDRNRRRLRAEGRPCWICQAFGRDPRIDYALPPGHPMSFEVDELVPVSRHWIGGYRSPEQCAADYGNLASAHRACNQWRSNKTVAEVMAIAARERGRASEAEPLPQPWGI